MKLGNLLDLFSDTISVNLYFEDDTCTGVCDSAMYIINTHRDRKVVWLEIDPHRLKNEPLLNVGLRGKNEI